MLRNNQERYVSWASQCRLDASKCRLDARYGEDIDGNVMFYNATLYNYEKVCRSCT